MPRICGHQTTFNGASTILVQLARLLAVRQPRMPKSLFSRELKSGLGDIGHGDVRRSYILRSSMSASSVDMSNKRRTHVARINKTTTAKTIAPYRVPTPYAQRHEPVRATTKPIAQGPRKGAMIKPIVHVFNCAADVKGPRYPREWKATYHTCLKVEGVQIRNHIETLRSHVTVSCKATVA